MRDDPGIIDDALAINLPTISNLVEFSWNLVEFSSVYSRLLQLLAPSMSPRRSEEMPSIAPDAAAEQSGLHFYHY